MVGDHVVLLSRVLLDVIEFRVIDQSPARGHAHRAAPLFRLEGPLALDEQGAVGNLRFGVEQLRAETPTVEIHIPGKLEPAQIDERGQHVDVRVERGDVLTLPQPAGRPVDEARHAVAAVVDITLLAAHAGVEELHAHRFRRCRS